MTRPIVQSSHAVAPATLDKVERLLEVLEAIREDPVLGDTFVLQGGTALNVFHDDLPRLSVDIDVMYVRSADLAEMQRDRPSIDRRIREVMGKLGYTTRALNDEHSGQTYRLAYGSENIKIDISYLARVPLLAPHIVTCTLADPHVSFPVLDTRELAAGKIKALMERVAARDLYDLRAWRTDSPRCLRTPSRVP
jgi:predicted nucleotidyltransferase component of viral defense system